MVYTSTLRARQQSTVERDASLGVAVLLQLQGKPKIAVLLEAEADEILAVGRGTEQATGG